MITNKNPIQGGDIAGSISPIHTFVNIPALLIKNTLRYLIRAGIFTKVWIGDIADKTFAITRFLAKILPLPILRNVPISPKIAQNAQYRRIFSRFISKVTLWASRMTSFSWFNFSNLVFLTSIWLRLVEY